jgi:hypothetical protein
VRAISDGKRIDICPSIHLYIHLIHFNYPSISIIHPSQPSIYPSISAISSIYSSHLPLPISDQSSQVLFFLLEVLLRICHDLVDSVVDIDEEYEEGGDDDDDDGEEYEEDEDDDDDYIMMMIMRMKMDNK